MLGCTEIACNHWHRGRPVSCTAQKKKKPTKGTQTVQSLAGAQLINKLEEELERETGGR